MSANEVNTEVSVKELPSWVQKQFDALVNRPGHAFLLTGATGLNQFDLALALAAAWLCEQPDPATKMACGVCEGCHMFAAHTHPDLQVLLPQDLSILLEWEGAADASEESKGAKPSREIRVEALRSMIEFTQRTPSRSKAQMVVIYPAERMNAISANTLLKTLEEPAGKDVRFILATENEKRLLPTILSRCQIHAMTWPRPEEALLWLEQQGITNAQALLDAAGGKPLQAKQLSEQGLDGRTWVRIPQALAEGDASVFDGLSVAQMLDIVSKLCHDLLLVHVGATPRFFPAQTLPKQVKENAVLAWSKEIMQAMRVAEHPWNVPLYTQTLVATAQRILRF
ncbi:MAG: DNA polymerase III subunit delta' [Saezia sp.]